MITIHNLEIQFDVEGDEDHEVFAKMFNQLIEQWSRQSERIDERRRQTERQRTLSDQSGDDRC